MSNTGGQDPDEIKMGTVDEEESGKVQGTVILGIDPEGGKVVFFEDFSIEGSPKDTVAYLAEDGNLNKSIELGELKEKSGSFRLPLPEGTDTIPYNTVVLRSKSSKKKIATIEL
ncbi:MAG: hypothetical protein KME17_19720 [Cyanosarcina radialis HA8281-LM2]|jgi:hypothetical protein|nr:hypothetical protein [Cyanosarcina radialis HA8281-LM2]